MLGDMGIAPQRTLSSVTGCRGIGLHCGQPVAMLLRPAPADTGIVFRRLDAGAEIRARWTSTPSAGNVSATVTWCTPRPRPKAKAAA